MKKLAITVATATLFMVSSFRPAPRASVGKSGLYLTTDDFLKSRLRYADASSGSEYKIKVHDGLFGAPTVDLVYNGKKEVFALNKVYGYRDSKGVDYRFFDRGVYRIEDTTGFYLYSSTKMVQGEKIARPQAQYFFSVQPNGNVQQLTLPNLESAFAENAQFRYGLEALAGHFRGDLELAAYDGMLKTYKIKYLYAQSLHQ
jgi:hypothetical protein